MASHPQSKVGRKEVLTAASSLVDDDGRETFYVVDFYCAESRLVVEVDGRIHDFTRTSDNARTKVLESRGLRVLRVMNSEVENNLSDVLDRISKEL